MKKTLLVRPEIIGLFGNTLTADHMYFFHRWEKSAQHFQTILSQQSKKFSQILIAILLSTQNFLHFEKTDQLHSVNILEFIEPGKCGYFNGRKLLFQNTFRESTCSQVRNTTATCTAAFLFLFSFNGRQVELEKISLSQISNLRMPW